MLTIKLGATWTQFGPVGGTWAHALPGAIGDLTYSTAWPIGSLAASWQQSLPVGFTHPAIRTGSLVELYRGPLRIWMGTLADPDRIGWSFAADGLGRQCERIAAVDGAGLPTTNIRTAVNAAIGRGWRLIAGSLPPSASLSAASESASNLNTLADLFAEHWKQTGQRFAVDANGVISTAPDPVAVRWSLAPGVPAMATTDEGLTTRIFGKRVSAVAGTPEEPSAWDAQSAEDVTAAQLYGPSERIEDLTNLGLISAASAQAILKAMLDAGASTPRFSQAVEVTMDQITTPGGTSPEPWQVAAGALVKHHGFLSADGTRTGATRNWVAGTVTHRAGENRVTIAPADIAPRTQAAVAAAQERATRKKFE